MDIITVRQCPLGVHLLCTYLMSSRPYLLPSVFPFYKCSKSGGGNSLRTMLRPYMPKQKLIVRAFPSTYGGLRWCWLLQTTGPDEGFKMLLTNYGWTPMSYIVIEHQTLWLIYMYLPPSKWTGKRWHWGHIIQQEVVAFGVRSQQW